MIVGVRDFKLLKNEQKTKGLLIEHDAGFIDPLDERNKPFVNELKNISIGKPVIEEPLFVYVILQKYGVLNRNGRVYPESVLKYQVNVYQQRIKDRAAVGELNHPESSILDGERLSHNITEIWWEGHTLMGKMEILMSPGFIKYGIISCVGDHVANLLRHRIKIGVSSRGVGSLVQGKNEEQIVQDDFEIIGWDVVVDPSTPGSWIFTNKEDAKPYVENVSVFKPKLNETVINVLDNFILL